MAQRPPNKLASGRVALGGWTDDNEERVWDWLAGANILLTAQWFLRIGNHVGEPVSIVEPCIARRGGGGRRCEWTTRHYRQAEVDFATSMPILASSPTIRGAPHSGLAVDMRLIRSRTSLARSAGRRGFPERQRRADGPGIAGAVRL